MQLLHSWIKPEPLGQLVPQQIEFWRLLRVRELLACPRAYMLSIQHSPWCSRCCEILFGIPAGHESNFSFNGGGPPLIELCPAHWTFAFHQKWKGTFYTMYWLKKNQRPTLEQTLSALGLLQQPLHLRLARLCGIVPVAKSQRLSWWIVVTKGSWSIHSLANLALEQSISRPWKTDTFTPSAAWWKEALKQRDILDENIITKPSFSRIVCGNMYIDRCMQSTDHSIKDALLHAHGRYSIRSQKLEGCVIWPNFVKVLKSAPLLHTGSNFPRKWLSKFVQEICQSNLWIAPDYQQGWHM